MKYQYTVYGIELSLFTRKLEAAMIFYGAPFERKPKTQDNREEIEHRSGRISVSGRQRPLDFGPYRALGNRVRRSAAEHAR